MDLLKLCACENAKPRFGGSKGVPCVIRRDLCTSCSCSHTTKDCNAHHTCRLARPVTCRAAAACQSAAKPAQASNTATHRPGPALHLLPSQLSCGRPAAAQVCMKNAQTPLVMVLCNNRTCVLCDHMACNTTVCLLAAGQSNKNGARAECTLTCMSALLFPLCGCAAVHSPYGRPCASCQPLQSLHSMHLGITVLRCFVCLPIRLPGENIPCVCLLSS